MKDHQRMGSIAFSICSLIISLLATACAVHEGSATSLNLNAQQQQQQQLDSEKSLNSAAFQDTRNGVTGNGAFSNTSRNPETTPLPTAIPTAIPTSIPVATATPTPVPTALPNTCEAMHSALGGISSLLAESKNVSYMIVQKNSGEVLTYGSSNIQLKIDNVPQGAGRESFTYNQISGISAVANQYYANHSTLNGKLYACLESTAPYACTPSSPGFIATFMVNADNLAPNGNIYMTDINQMVTGTADGYTINQGGNQDCGYLDMNETNSPLVIDVSGAGIAFKDPLSTQTWFDLDGDGRKDRISCLSAGMYLALPDEHGQIKNIDQLFGNRTKGPDGDYAANGFLALAKYDDNGDGVIDGKDAVFSKLRLWRDRNCDGASSAGELIRASAVLKSINLGSKRMFEEDRYGNQTLQRSTVQLLDGAFHLIVDVWLNTSN